ncbi:MAG: M48 family metalloprotease [Candidatus Riflebacteria bacterium]|nr:M48 family metalloprotease [Candidatus Riflebacteria bacterium]
MKKYTFMLLALLIVLISGLRADAKNILKDIFKVYQKYQEINMTLWLVGDVGAEKRFGKELQMWMGLMYKQEKDPKINAYVKGIFERLKPHFNNRGMNFDLRVIRDSTANAFVIPGGHVYVFTGLLDMVGSDDELAAVISHELAHAERRHSLKNFRASTAAVAVLNAAVKNKKDRATWGNLLGYLTLMQFSRQQEDEADDIGQFRMATAGFNPAAQVTLWEKFLQKHGDTKGLAQYLSTHPPSSKRVENARNNLRKMNVTEQSVFNNTRLILSADQINLIINASFESASAGSGNLAGWEVGSGKALLNEQQSITGRRSLELLAEQRLTPVRVLSDFIAINEASDLTFTGWARSENGQQNAAIGIELYDANKRLRDRAWPIRESSALSASWISITARMFNTPEKRLFAPGNAFMRLVLQTGPISQGRVWFDDLRLRPTESVDPVNLLYNGDFERRTAEGYPEALTVRGGQIGIDLSKANSGYSSLLVRGAASGESGFSFKPVSLAGLKYGHEFTCSFFFQSDRQLKGTVVVEMLDEKGSVLARRLAEISFEAVAGNWTANSFAFKFEPQGAEVASAKNLQIRVATSMPADASLWLDTFIMR